VITEIADPGQAQSAEKPDTTLTKPEQPEAGATGTAQPLSEPAQAGVVTTETEHQGQRKEAERAAESEQPEDSGGREDARTPDAQAIAAADEAVLKASRRHTRRSFVAAALGAAAGYGFYSYLDYGPEAARQPDLMRRAFEANAALSKRVFQEHVLAPTYPRSKAENLRVNGTYGLKMALLEDSWRLQLVGMKDAARHPRYVNDVTEWEYRYSEAAAKEDQGHDTKVAPKTQTAEKMASEEMMVKGMKDENPAGRKPRGREEAGESRSTLRPGTPGLLLTMEDILKLPRQELVTQFKCIEGWSQIVHWAGVRMADFIELNPPELIEGKDPKYIYMETPDGDYYTGYDFNSMRHPQALLVTEMMGAPLTQFHGAPLRLHLPTKYGYKQIKRIGLVAYTNDKPDDYWTKLGYDWYAGL